MARVLALNKQCSGRERDFHLYKVDDERDGLKERYKKLNFNLNKQK